MSGPAFGFSVGDFITAIELTSKVIKSLKKTGGASSRYIQVLNLLENLGRIFKELESLKPTQDDASFVNAIRGAARAAQFPLNDFLAKIEKYEPALNPVNRKHAAVKALKAAKWGVWVEEEVEKLQLSLDAHLLSLSLLLQLRDHRVGDIKESRRRLDHEQTTTMLSRQSTMLEDVQTNLMSIRSDSPKRHKKTLEAVASVHLSSQANAAAIDDVKQLAVGLANQVSQLSGESNKQFQQVAQSVVTNTETLLTLQRNLARTPVMPPDSCIYLLDALDRSHKQPYEHFQNFALVQTHLTSQFKKFPGSLQVRAGLYQLVREGRSPKLVTGDDWSNLVFSGCRISMAIMLSSLRIPANRCPRPNCHRESRVNDLDKSKLQCEHCGLIYYPYSPKASHGPQSEVKTVLKLQSKVDKRHFGRRFPPKDISVIASLSDGTMSHFTKTSRTKSLLSDSTGTSMKQSKPPAPRFDASLPLGLTATDMPPYLTVENLLRWDNQIEDYPGHQSDIGQESPNTKVSLPMMDWKSGPSAMMAWLNQSAIPEPGAQPPSIEEASEHDGESVDEEEDIETLRRVCVARSVPAMRHYLDAPEYVNLDVRALPYLRKIVDRFPALPTFVARRLAERNLSWVQKLATLKNEEFTGD